MDSDEFLLLFDTDSSDFARGFACGEIWACLTDEVEEVHCLATVDNIEMIMRMAEAANYSFSARDISDSESELLDVEDSSDWVVVVMRNKDV